LSNKEPPMAHWIDDGDDDDGPVPWALGDDDAEPVDPRDAADDGDGPADECSTGS
jgi:hypothetical protein